MNKLSELGIRGIQLDDGGPHRQGFPLRDRSVQSLYREYSERYDVALISMGGNELGRSGGLIQELDSPRGEICREIFQNGIQACREMEIPVRNQKEGISGMAGSGERVWPSVF